MKYTEELKTCYLVELSNKTKIQIDPDELPKVVEGIKSGNPVVVRQGIFNPSFFVSIVHDEQRITQILEFNETIRFQISQGTAKPDKLEPLSDIFAEMRDKLLLEKK